MSETITQGNLIFVDAENQQRVIDVDNARWAHMHLDGEEEDGQILKVEYQDETEANISLTQRVIDFLESSRREKVLDGVSVTKIYLVDSMPKCPVSRYGTEQTMTIDEWTLEEVKHIANEYGNLEDIARAITERPEIWKVTTPQGECNFLSHEAPEVALCQDRYYVFVCLWDCGIEVYRTTA